jgi:hypothetical protein
MNTPRRGEIAASFMVGSVNVGPTSGISRASKILSLLRGHIGHFGNQAMAHASRGLRGDNGHMYAQRALFHHPILPVARQRIVRSHHAAGALDQAEQYIQSTGPTFHRHALPLQPELHRKQTEWPNQTQLPLILLHSSTLFLRPRLLIVEAFYLAGLFSVKSRNLTRFQA